MEGEEQQILVRWDGNDSGPIGGYLTHLIVNLIDCFFQFSSQVNRQRFDKIPHLPESPGVYLWRDADGTVLYVGKAKRLRSRVRSYVTNDQLTSVKTRALMQQAAGLDTIAAQPMEPDGLGRGVSSGVAGGDQPHPNEPVTRRAGNKRG